jgi:hypothetical protein
LTLRTLFNRKPKVAKRQGYLSEGSFAGIYKTAEEQGAMSSGLRRRLAGN